jgi:hypothetical protein
LPCVLADKRFGRGLDCIVTNRRDGGLERLYSVGRGLNSMFLGW